MSKAANCHAVVNDGMEGRGGRLSCVISPYTPTNQPSPDLVYHQLALRRGEFLNLAGKDIG